MGTMNATELDALWLAWKNDPTTANRDSIVTKFMYQVDAMAKRAKRRWWKTLDLDVGDLTSEGLMGLYRAIERCDPSKGSFFRYGFKAIWTSIRNFIRQELHQRKLTLTLANRHPQRSAYDPGFARVDEQDVLDALMNRLQPRTAQIVQQQLGGKRYQDIKREFHVTSETCVNARRDAISTGRRLLTDAA